MAIFAHSSRNIGQKKYICEKEKDMSIRKITLTEDHLKLVSQFRFSEMPDIRHNESVLNVCAPKELGAPATVKKVRDGVYELYTENDGIYTINYEEVMDKPIFGLDMTSLYGGSYLCEDVAYILGRYDEHIEGTEEDPQGVRFPREVEDYFWNTHNFILENLREIEEIVHQFALKGGVTAGTYKCRNNEHIWVKVNE